MNSSTLLAKAEDALFRRVREAGLPEPLELGVLSVADALYPSCRPYWREAGQALARLPYDIRRAVVEVIRRHPPAENYPPSRRRGEAAAWAMGAAMGYFTARSRLLDAACRAWQAAKERGSIRV